MPSSTGKIDLKRTLMHYFNCPFYWYLVFPMKRIDQLKILSHDHHVGLVFARRMKQVAASKDSVLIQAGWVEIEAYYKTELKPHFHIEESLLAPALMEHGKIEMVDKMQTEHAELQQFFTAECHQTIQDLHDFGVLLAQHIRFEERELFDVAQDILSSDILDHVARASFKMHEADNINLTD